MSKPTDKPGGEGPAGTGRGDRPGKGGGSGGPPTGAQPVQPRRDRYLVAALHPQLAAAGLVPFGGPGLDPAAALAQLHADPACTVHRVITPGGTARNGAGLPPGAVDPTFPSVAVVEMDADRAAMFAASPLLHVEPDRYLEYATPSPVAGINFADPGLIPFGASVTVPFTVTSSDGTPLPDAEVYVISPTFPVRGETGPDGTARLELPADALRAVTGVYVKPRCDHWAIWLARPELRPDVAHAITCPRLSDTFPDFPTRELDSWARRAMRFDAIPPTFRGHGVKIAVVDSGAALDHPDLTGRVRAGCDIAGQNDTGWRVDTVGHGSACAGIVGGSDNGAGIVGVVPEAELHACKIFPGGRFSDLIEALDYCIVNQVDVVNLSLGNPQPSELLAAKIEQARQAGVACVVAAGNTGGPVSFPALLPGVLAVAAIGKMGEFPPGSYHATQVAGVPTPEGYFSAKFTCHGPEIDVCAPGVAIVSCVPPANYAAWDGTSFAAPHVSALAALLLAHHPEFRDRFAIRNAARVDRLFELIRGSCQPLPLGEPGRAGAGLPDALRALGLVPPVPPVPPANPVLAGLWTAMAQAGLVAAAVPLAPVGAGVPGGYPAGGLGFGPGTGHPAGGSGYLFAPFVVSPAQAALAPYTGGMGFPAGGPALSGFGPGPLGHGPTGPTHPGALGHPGLPTHPGALGHTGLSGHPGGLGHPGLPTHPGGLAPHSGPGQFGGPAVPGHFAGLAQLGGPGHPGLPGHAGGAGHSGRPGPGFDGDGSFSGGLGLGGGPGSPGGPGGPGSGGRPGGGSGFGGGPGPGTGPGMGGGPGTGAGPAGSAAGVGGHSATWAVPPGTPGQPHAAGIPAGGPLGPGTPPAVTGGPAAGTGRPFPAGIAFTTGAGDSTDALTPLRNALRAAGLLGPTQD